MMIFFQDTLLLNVVIEQLINDRDPELGGAVQLSGVLRLLIDPENMLAALNKSEKADFLNLFYKQSMSLLIGIFNIIFPSRTIKLFIYLLVMTITQWFKGNWYSGTTVIIMNVVRGILVIGLDLNFNWGIIY